MRYFKIFILIFFFLKFKTFAQNGGPPPPGLPDDPVAVPVNQYIPVLLIAGVLFGAYTMVRKK